MKIVTYDVSLDQRCSTTVITITIYNVAPLIRTTRETNASVILAPSPMLLPSNMIRVVTAELR